MDFNYISLVDALLSRGVSEQQILNPPALIKYQSEKVPPPALAAHSPLLKVVFSKQDALEAQKLFGQHPMIVTKPMNNAQSIGVKKWETPQTESAWLSLFDNETHGFTSPILVEEYLPMINEGEVRMWFAFGKFIAALKKYPAQGDFRVLIDSGSRVTAYDLNPSEMLAAEAVGEVLKKQGAALAAIDFIGSKISDYNITSPGLLTQLEQVHGGKNFARQILDILVAH